MVMIAGVAAAVGVAAGVLLTRDDELEAKYGLVGIARQDDPVAVYEPRVIYRDSGSIARVEGLNGCATDSERVVLVNPLWFREITSREQWLREANDYCQ